MLMKTIEMVTTYILDPINSVYNYAKYSMYFDRLLYNGPNFSYTLDFQTITYNRLPQVTVLKLYYSEYMLHFDDGIHIPPDQTLELELYLVSSLKLMRKDLHVTLLGNIFLTTGKLGFVLYP